MRRRRPSAGGRGPRGAADGVLWLYGRHAVGAALANPARTIRRLVATGEAARALGLDGSRPPPPETAARREIAALLPAGAVHQGVALCAEPLAEPVLADIVAAGAPHRDLLILLDQATDPRNIGAVLRSAAAFGAAAVVTTRRHAPPESGALAKAASGALEWVPLVRVANLARTMDMLKNHGYWCVGLDAGAERTLADAGVAGPVALVLGSEGRGLRRLTGGRCDLLVRVPQRRRGAGLNLSNAAAIALYEMARRASAKQT